MADKEFGSITYQERVYGVEAVIALNREANSRRFVTQSIAEADRQNVLAYLSPRANSATLDARGLAIQAIDSSVANAKAMATTNFLTSQRRVGYGALAAASASAGFFPSQPHFWRGNAEGLGGFSVDMAFGLEQLVSAAQTRFFFGLCGAVTPNDLEPSAMVNMVGIGADIGDTNLQVMHNDGTGTATKVDLGADFPAKTAGVCYRLILVADPNAANMRYWVDRIDVAQEASGTLGANLPASTTFIGPCLYNQNGTGGGSGVETSLLGFHGRTGA